MHSRIMKDCHCNCNHNYYMLSIVFSVHVYSLYPLLPQFQKSTELTASTTSSFTAGTAVLCTLGNKICVTSLNISKLPVHIIVHMHVGNLTILQAFPLDAIKR